MDQSLNHPALQASAPAPEMRTDSSAGRDWLCRFVFSIILAFLLYYFFSHTLLHQLGQPALTYPYVDPSYWLILLTGLPAMLTHAPIASALFDTTLVLSCVLVVFMPRRRIFIILFFFLYGTYFIVFNLYGGLHTGSRIGILLAPIPFMATGNGTFVLLWEGLRYFTLFTYADAFLWKLFRGTWLHSQQGILIVRKNLAAYLYLNPATVQAKVYYWSLQHPVVTNGLFSAGFIMEGFFVIGFFTRRYDRYLFLVSLVLPLGFLFFADAFFFGQYILSLTLLNWNRIFNRPGVTGRL
jgi:hypothetical protein